MNLLCNDSCCISDHLHEFQGQNVTNARQETSGNVVPTENYRK